MSPTLIIEDRSDSSAIQLALSGPALCGALMGTYGEVWKAHDL